MINGSAFLQLKQMHFFLLYKSALCTNRDHSTKKIHTERMQNDVKIKNICYKQQKEHSEVFCPYKNII